MDNGLTQQQLKDTHTRAVNIYTILVQLWRRHPFSCLYCCCLSVCCSVCQYVCVWSFFPHLRVCIYVYICVGIGARVCLVLIATTARERLSKMFSISVSKLCQPKQRRKRDDKINENSDATQQPNCECDSSKGVGRTVDEACFYDMAGRKYNNVYFQHSDNLILLYLVFVKIISMTSIGYSHTIFNKIRSEFKRNHEIYIYSVRLVILKIQ